MAKQHFLVSPFGPVTLRVHPSHIHIESPDPLAGDWGLGWWHAHHAGDEAVFARSFWRGELGAEPRPSTGRTELDTFVRHWAFDADLTLEISHMSAGHRARTHAYTQGFNQGRRRRGREAPWAIEDCHLLARTLGFLEWWETRAPQVEFLISAWQQGLSWARVLDLWPGLGTEPDKAAWKGLTFHSFSPEAWTFLDKIRRFRPSSTWVVPASRSAGGAPLLGASYVSDVSEPGLPFCAVRIDSLSKKVRGLSRPGHPGFLSGRTASLAWYAVPAVDDSIDLRVLDPEKGTLAGQWAGSGRTGTLEGLLALETATGAAQAREKTLGLGSACLDFVAVDAAEAVRWAMGPKWLRAAPRDSWLPAPWGTDAPVGARAQPSPVEEEVPNRATAGTLEALLAQTKSRLPESALPVLRFLLPDTEEGRRLRRWTGVPETGPEQQAFERLYGAVLESFWESCPRAPHGNAPLSQTLAPVIDRLILAPHSSWFPSHDKNQRLAEAVRRAFAPGAAAPVLLSRRAPKPTWVETHGGKDRTFASTVALVADLSVPGWKTFVSDDETEIPEFSAW